MPRTSQPAPFLFSPEDEERLAYRLGLLNEPCLALNSGREVVQIDQQLRFFGEALALQESEHVLRYEYLGL